jgi:hypothetical protein
MDLDVTVKQAVLKSIASAGAPSIASTAAVGQTVAPGDGKFV